jgi:hypothetical protein
MKTTLTVTDQKTITEGINKLVLDTLKNHVATPEIAKVVASVDTLIEPKLKALEIDKREVPVPVVSKVRPFRKTEAYSIVRGIRRVIAKTLKGVSRKEMTAIKNTFASEVQKQLLSMKVERVNGRKRRSRRTSKLAAAM